MNINENSWIFGIIMVIIGMVLFVQAQYLMACLLFYMASTQIEWHRKDEETTSDCQ